MVNTLAESALPVPLGHNAPSRTPVRIEISSAFLAQLIAVRTGAADYRFRRREEPTQAMAAYRRARQLSLR